MLLTSEQQNIFNKICAFLTTDEPAIIIDGSGGTGKSFLIGALNLDLLKTYTELCNSLSIPKKYSALTVTSTTNKACDSLSNILHEEVPTIHNYIGLTIDHDYKTGKESLKPTPNFSPRRGEIIIIDEASMINYELFDYINIVFGKGNKIIYVGDQFQLTPVRESISKIYKQNYRVLPITNYIRQSNKDLITLADTCKAAIKNKHIHINLVPNSIELLNQEDTFKYLHKHFSKTTDKHRVCCYTNNCCIEYNNYIHYQVKKQTEPFFTGQKLISNSVLHSNNSLILHVEDEVTIADVDTNPTSVELSATNPNLKLDVYKATLVHSNIAMPPFNTFLPADQSQVKAVLKTFAKEKDWISFYRIKDYLPDLRYSYASTVHKAQGSTVDTVLIDLDNLSTCRNPDTFYRLLYVACTRARQKVYFYGTLAKKFGDIT